MIFQPVTVPAECSNWPLDTFLDALSFVRCDGTPPDFADSDNRICCLTADRELIEPVARHAPWHDVVGYRAPDLSSAFSICPNCGGVGQLTFFYAKEPGDEHLKFIVSELCTSCCDDSEDGWDDDAEYDE